MALFEFGDIFLTARELADALNIDRTLLYRRWRAWSLPGLFVGGQLRFDPDDVIEWLKARKQAETEVGR